MVVGGETPSDPPPESPFSRGVDGRERSGWGMGCRVDVRDLLVPPLNDAGEAHTSADDALRLLEGPPVGSHLRPSLPQFGSEWNDRGPLRTTVRTTLPRRSTGR